MRKLLAFLVSVLLIAALVTGCGGEKKAPADNQAVSEATGKVTIGIGYQSPTAQTWGAVVMKNQQLFEKELQAKFPKQEFTIEWFNSPSGPPLTNNMIASKLQLAFMGDMPILINGEKGETMPNYKSVFVAFDGKGLGGKNQALMIPKDSNMGINDLEGKTISTILGSSAHRMLLAALDKHGLTGKVNIVNQDVMVGMSSIEQNKIDAHATWEPYPSLILHDKVGKVLIDGADTGVDYLDGVVADRTWAEAHPDYMVAFMKALIKAHQMIRENPVNAAEIFAAETSYPPEVCKKMAENIRFDAAIYERDLKTLEGSKDFLSKLEKLNQLDLNRFVDKSYLEKAAKEMGMSYLTDAESKNAEWLSGKVY